LQRIYRLRLCNVFLTCVNEQVEFYFLRKKRGIQRTERWWEESGDVRGIHVRLCCGGRWLALSSPAVAPAAAVPRRRRPMKLRRQRVLLRRRSPPVLPGSEGTPILPATDDDIMVHEIKEGFLAYKLVVSRDLTWANCGCTAAAPCIPNPLNME
jgi:hypothetical protein